MPVDLLATEPKRKPIDLLATETKKQPVDLLADVPEGGGEFRGAGATGEFGGIPPEAPGVVEAPEFRVPRITTPETGELLRQEAERRRKFEGGVEEPFVDPVTAFVGGAAATAKLAPKGFRLLRGALGGATALATEPVIGQATEVIAGSKHPELAFPFALVFGLTSGSILEAPVERAIFKSAMKILRKRGVKTTTANIQKTINELKPEDVGIKKPKARIAKGPIESEFDFIIGKTSTEEFVTDAEKISKATEGQANINLKDTEINKLKITPEPVTEQPFAGQLAFGQELPKFAKNINLERIDAGEAPKKLITDVTGANLSKINEARRGKITFEETRRLAEDLGLTDADLLKRRKGQAFNAEEATAARDVLNTSATNLRETQIKAATSGSPEDLAKFKLAFERHALIQAEVSGFTAEAGRALSAFRIKSKNAGNLQQTKNFKAMLDAVGGRDLTEDILDKLSKIDPTDQIAVNKFIRSAVKATTKDMIFEAWVNSLLSSPVTHVVNNTSNALIYLSSIPESITGATIDFARAGLSRTQRGRFFGETPQRIFGAYEGVKSGTRKALWSFVNEMPSEGISKLELAGKFQSIPGKAGKIIRLPGRALIAADEFFKAVNFESEMRVLAYRQAVKEGKRGTARAQRIGEILVNPDAKLTEKARQEALYRTFQKALGPSGKALQRLRTTLPGLRYIVPFLRTPVNIAKFGLERTPLNYARIFRRALKGELKGGDLSDELAKTTIGSFIGATVFMYAKEGKITGGGPKNPEERAALFNTGWQPYSIKTGDQYISYQRLEPLGMIFGTAADAAEIWDNLEGDKQENIAALIVTSIGKNFINKTFMRGVSDAFNAIHDPVRYGERWTHNFGGTIIPSGVAQLSRAIDPVLRKPENFIEKIKTRIPGKSVEVFPRRNIFGEIIEKGEGNLPERLLSPVQRSRVKKGFIENEIVRLNLRIGLPSKKISGVELTPSQFDRFVSESGQFAKQLLNNFIKSGRYRAIPTDELKADVIKKIINAARDQTKGKFIKEIGTDRIREEILNRYGF